MPLPFGAGPTERIREQMVDQRVSEVELATLLTYLPLNRRYGLMDFTAESSDMGLVFPLPHLSVQLEINGEIGSGPVLARGRR